MFYIKISIGLQVLLLLSCGILFGQKYNSNKEYQTTWGFNNLKGKVKSVSIKSYHNTPNDSIGNIIKHFKKLFELINIFHH